MLLYESHCHYNTAHKCLILCHATLGSNPELFEIAWLYYRDYNKSKGKSDSMLRQEVIAVTKSGETYTLAEFVGTEWSLIDAQWFICFHNNQNDDGHLLKLTGPRNVRICLLYLCWNYFIICLLFFTYLFNIPYFALFFFFYMQIQHHWLSLSIYILSTLL